jgi:hypothetical protein
MGSALVADPVSLGPSFLLSSTGGRKTSPCTHMMYILLLDNLEKKRNPSAARSFSSNRLKGFEESTYAVDTVQYNGFPTTIDYNRNARLLLLSKQLPQRLHFCCCLCHNTIRMRQVHLFILGKERVNVSSHANTRQPKDPSQNDRRRSTSNRR